MKQLRVHLAASTLLISLTACHQGERRDESTAVTPDSPATSAAVSDTSHFENLTDEELLAIIAQQELRHTPISDDEWRQITKHPYSRAPFQHNTHLSQRYFDAYLAARRGQWVDPGSLRLPPMYSGDQQTLFNAAWVTGWGAGMTRQTNQLTAEERDRIRELKRMYDESLGYPFSNG